MDVLLAGGELVPGPQLNLARAAGLSPERRLLVIVARPLAPIVDDAGLRVAAVALARAMGDATEPLCAVRGDEVVVVRSTFEAEAPAVTAALEVARDRLADRTLALAVGVSTLHTGSASVPAGYHEACLAVEQLRGRGGVLALGRLGVADYLILRAGDRTAWRLVPRAVRSFVADDARQGGVLSDTLLAYVGSSLSVKVAAERLFVHPNTAHYRLSKIEERTGCSIRSLPDVLLLWIAVRLHRERAA
jgi:DNA-binding PucR family transcriptional regulator